MLKGVEAAVAGGPNYITESTLLHLSHRIIFDPGDKETVKKSCDTGPEARAQV